VELPVRSNDVLHLLVTQAVLNRIRSWRAACRCRRGSAPNISSAAA